MIEAPDARGIPAIGFAALCGGRKPLVLAPHPDDEALGCGTLLAQAFAGPGAHVVCMTDGAASHPGSASHPPAALAACRAAELDAAIEALGGGPGDITRLGLPDAGMGALGGRYDAIADDIAALVTRMAARILIAPAATDPHCDHVATAEIARRAARRAGVRLLSYPIWSRWAVPDFRDRLGAAVEYRLDPAGMGARKARAIAAHASQHGELIQDAPEGFVLPAEFVAMFLETDEIFFDCDAA